jgi:hypothetical protein
MLMCAFMCGVLLILTMSIILTIGFVFWADKT